MARPRRRDRRDVAEAFRPYSPVLANLTGVCWWGWIPTCGFTAILSASALHQWYVPFIPVTPLAVGIVLTFVVVNLLGVKVVTRVAIPVACAAALLALLSAVIPVVAGTVDVAQATSFHLDTPFEGAFGVLTSAMAGLYLVGFAAPAFEAAACHVGEMKDPARNLPRSMLVSGGLAGVYFIVLPLVWLGTIGPVGLDAELTTTIGPMSRRCWPVAPRPRPSGSWSPTCSWGPCSRSRAHRARCHSSPRTGCCRTAGRSAPSATCRGSRRC